MRTQGKGKIVPPTPQVLGLYKIFDEIIVNAADNKQWECGTLGWTPASAPRRKSSEGWQNRDTSVASSDAAAADIAALSLASLTRVPRRGDVVAAAAAEGARAIRLLASTWPCCSTTSPPYLNLAAFYNISALYDDFSVISTSPRSTYLLRDILAIISSTRPQRVQSVGILEPHVLKKVSHGEDRSNFATVTMADFDGTMKRYSDDLLRAVEGVSSML